MIHILAVALSLDAGAASHFAKLALKCVRQEYPNKLDHVMSGAQEVQSPRALHPSFYGCYDWHSSVHGHWMLARLLRKFPELPEAGRHPRGARRAPGSAAGRGGGGLLRPAQPQGLRADVWVGLALETAGRAPLL